MAFLFAVGFLTPNTVCAQGTAFTYQGQLMNNGASRRLAIMISQFAIFDAASNGNQIGASLTNAPTAVSNGLFTVTLDFGAGVFSGPQRWLQIGVRTNGSSGAYTILAPLQEVTASPYAITAGNFTGTINGSQIQSGTISGSQISGGTVTSTQLASGAAAANLDASGQSGVASGGVVLSPNANATNLLNTGYTKIGQTQLGELWTTLGLAVAPEPRYGQTAVWTGTEMIVWGGYDGTNYFNDGRIYNPALNTWSAMTPYGAPTARTGHTAVWTGTNMIVWGGYNGSSWLNDGWIYNPANDQWTPLSPINAPSVARIPHGRLDGNQHDCLGRLQWQQLSEQRRQLQSGQRHLDRHQHQRRARHARKPHGHLDGNEHDCLGRLQWQQLFEQRRKL